MIKLPNISLNNTEWTVTEAITRGGTVSVPLPFSLGIGSVPFSLGIGGDLLSMTLKNNSGDTISLRGRGSGITGGIGMSMPVVNVSVSRKDISPKHPGIGNVVASNNYLNVDDDPENDVSSSQSTVDHGWYSRISHRKKTYIGNN